MQTLFSQICCQGLIKCQELLVLPKLQQLLKVFAEEESESDELGDNGEAFILLTFDLAAPALASPESPPR